MSNTARQVEEILENFNIPYENWQGKISYDSGWDVWDEISDGGETPWYDVPALGNVRVIQSKTGSEGDWHTEVYMVFVVDAPGETRFYKKTGHYASHDGQYWDGYFKEVTPRTESVTIYD
jgi:hypothetical protein